MSKDAQMSGNKGHHTLGNTRPTFYHFDTHVEQGPSNMSLWI